MPLYEYACDAGHHFEVKQKLSDAPITTCQVCARPVSRLISPSAISFKGGGWYVTDYSEKMKPPATQEKTAAAGDAKNETKKETASTPDSKSSSDSANSATPAPSAKPTTGSGSSPSTPSGS